MRTARQRLLSTIGWVTLLGNCPIGDSVIQEKGRPIPERLDGEVRHTAPSSKFRVSHHHDGVECDLVIRGSGRIIINDHSYDLRPGTLVWIPSGRNHFLIRSPTLEMWVVLFRSNLLPPEWEVEMDLRPARILPGEELIELDRLLVQVAQDSDDPAVYNAGIRYALMRAWRATTELVAPSARPMHPAVSRALLLLREKDAALSLPELAAATGIGAPYLSRLLVENTGQSFLDWRNRIRLERFLKAYRPGDNLLNVALEAGFGSYSRFLTVFQELMHSTPTDWARNGGGKGLSGASAAAMPEAPGVSVRLRWTRLVPLISPDVIALLGDDFIERLLTIPPGPAPEHPVPAAHLDASLTPEARRHFVSGLFADSPAKAEEFARIIEDHDFVGTYAGLIQEIGLSPNRLSDSITAALILLWLAAHQASDPSRDSMRAAAAQIDLALQPRRQNPQPALAQAAHSALICHSVVIYHALEAARAGGEAARRQLSQLAVDTARRMFGPDLMRVRLGADGFVAVR